MVFMAPRVDSVILIELIRLLAVLYAVEVQQYKRLKLKWRINQLVVNLSGVVTLTVPVVQLIKSLNITASNEVIIINTKMSFY